MTTNSTRTIAVLLSSAAAVLHGTAAEAQTPWTTQYEAGWVDRTETEIGYFASPLAACDYQRSKYDSGAANSTPYWTGDQTYHCVWTNRTNTIAESIVSFRCLMSLTPYQTWGDYPATGGTPSYCRPTPNPPPCNSSCSGEDKASDGLMKPSAPGNPITGNPVELSTGAKALYRTDYADAEGKLAIRRNYDSHDRAADDDSSFGAAWRGLLPLTGTIGYAADNYLIFYFTTAEGFIFRINGDPSSTSYGVDWLSPYSPRLSVTMEPLFTPPPAGTGLAYLQANDAQWRVTFGDGQSFVFSSSGASAPQIWRKLVLSEHRDADGYAIAYGYAATATTRRLNAITGPNGRALAVTSAAHGPTRIDLPDATHLIYSYDDATSNRKRLTRVERRRADNSVVSAEGYRYALRGLGTLLAGVDDADGDARANYDYDKVGRVASTEKGGGAESFDYAYLPGADSYHSVTRVTNPLGRATDTIFRHYDNQYARLDTKPVGVNGLVSANAPADARTMEYAWGDLTATVDKNGRRREYDYTTGGRPMTIRDGVGSSLQRTETISWWGTRNLPSEIVRPRQTVTYGRDTQGRVVTETLTDTTTHAVPYSTNGEARSWGFTYDAAGRVLSEDGPRTDVTDTETRAYTSGNLTSVTNALGHVTAFSLHDGNGNAGRVTDANGVVTDLVYDGAGRLSESIGRSTAGDRTTASAHDVDGRLTRSTLPDGTYLDYEYDAAERVSALVNNAGERIEIAYDAMGNPTSTVTKAAGGAITHQLAMVNDELGRVRSVTSGASHTTTHGYDVEGNATSSTDPLTRTTVRGFDLFNRQVSETDALSGVAGQAFDAQDNVTSVTDQRAVATGYVHNGFEEVIRETSPDGGTITYTRDKAGNVTSRTDARGVVANAAYDALNRLTGIAYPAAPTEGVTFGYDATASGNKGVGRLTAMTDRAGNASWRYDDRDLLVLENRTIGATASQTGYGHDAYGRQASITYPSGRVVEYTRDSLGRIASIATRDGAGQTPRPVASAIAYQPFGPVSALTHGNGVAATWGHDLAYRNTSIAASGTNPIQQLAIGWDAADNVTAITDALDASRSQTFGYDALDRLTSATGPYGTLGWTYDAAGNRITETQGGQSKTYAYSTTSNRLTGVSGSENRSFAYSATGNLASDDRGTAADLTFAYDSADRLVNVSDGTGTIQSAGYDGFGRRVVRTAGGVTRHYHYDQDDRLIATADASGSNWVEWLWLDDQLVAQVEGGNIYAIHSDHLGQPLKMTGASGAIVWQRQSKPFGATHAETGNPANPVRFPGQPTDPATATHYNMARDYDPTLGRYIQADPIGLDGGLNRWAYAESSPQTFVDPRGLNTASAPTPGGIAWDWWRKRQLRPRRATPWGRAIGLGEAIGAIAAVIAYECSRDDDDVEAERCREVVERCKEICIDDYADDRRRLPGMGSDSPGRLRRCIRECAAAEGCYNY